MNVVSVFYNAVIIEAVGFLGRNRGTAAKEILETNDRFTSLQRIVILHIAIVCL